MAALAAWMGVALVIVWLAAPPIAVLLGYTRITFDSDAGPEPLIAEMKKAWLAPVAQKLAEAGLAPVGRVFIRIRFNGVHWRGTIVEHLFAADDAAVAVFRFRSFDAARFGASSLMTDGLVFQTGSSMPDIKVEEPHYRRVGVSTSDPVALLAAHRELAGVLVHRGGEMVSPRSLEVCRRIIETEWNTVYCRTQLREVARAVLTIFCCQLLLGVMVAWFQSTWLRAALAILTIFGAQQALGLVAMMALTVRSWFRKA